MYRKRLFLLAVIFALSCLLPGCGGSSPTVSVTAAATSVDGTDTVKITAAVTNDSNSAGVTWSLSGSGALSSQTTTSATYTAPAATSAAQTVTITGTSIADKTKTGSVTISIPAAPSISTTGANLAGSVGPSYSVTLVGAGGIAPYKWTLTAGSLPGCLTMTSAGVISGTILSSCAGSFSLTFTMTDSGTPTALTANVPLTMVIAAAPAISFAASVPATGTYNVAYSGTLTASGGSGALTYALASGSLPPGVTLNASTGAIGGKPTSGGSYSFAVSASDAYGDSATSATYPLTIAYPGMSVTTAALPIGYVGSAYATTTLTATGGAGVVSNYTWALANGSALPAGLSLSAAGVISGTPTGSPATGTVTVSVSDSTSGLSTSATLPWTVNAGVTITQATPPTGYVGSAYTMTLAATGGSGIYSTWAVSSGSLPAGLSLNSTSGVINGTPTGTPATTNFTVKVTDSASNTATLGFSITVMAGVSITTPTSLADGYPNASYNPITLAATGGTGAYSTWAVTSGSLPAGMTLSTAGILGGTPTTAGAYSFSIQVTDSASNKGSSTFSLTVEAALAIAPSSLPSAATGISYAQSLTATGGSGGYVWSIDNTATNTLATYGLTFANGQVTGNPTTIGTANFTAVVTDSASHRTSQAYSIVISTLAISTVTLNYGAVGSTYSQTLAASGGAAPYTWTVTSGSANLAALGLSLTTAGALTSNGASLSTAGSAAFTAQVQDSGGASATANYTVNVYNALAFTTSSLNPAVYQANYSATIGVTGGSGNYTWTVNNGTLPASGTATTLTGGGGLTATLANSNLGTLTIGGLPTSYGAISLAVVVADSTTGASVNCTFTITVNSLTVSVDPQGIPQGMVGMPYTFSNVDIQNGNQPYTITYTNTPAGLAGNSSGQLVGAPTGTGATTVTVKVTDSSTPTAQVGSTTFSLPVVPQPDSSGNSKLSGQYACTLERYWDTGITTGHGTLYRGGVAFAFAANGSGTITGGESDSVSPSSAPKLKVALSGTYSIGSDNRGYITVTSGNGSFLVAVAGSNLSSSIFTELALVETDDAGTTPSGKYGSGHCYKQVTTALSGITPNGNYVFQWRGEDSSGNTEAAVGQVVFSGTTASGTIDMVDGTFVQTAQSFSNTIAATDSYGRMAMSSTGNGNTVVYLTNDSKGDALIMGVQDHSPTGGQDFQIGQTRAQVSAHIAASSPISGNAVLYWSGSHTFTSGSPVYATMAMQVSGSSTAKQFKVNSIAKNQAGTFTLDSDNAYQQTISYTNDTSTGRVLPTGQSGIYLYLYDTNSAVVLSAQDDGTGGFDNQVGWLEPQTTSGAWALGDVATSYVLRKVADGDYNTDSNDGVFSVASNGLMSGFAQDDSGNQFVSWQDPLSGSPAISATGTVVLNSTDGASYGLLDIDMTSGGPTTKQVQCYAISVDAATTSTAKGKLVCMDTLASSPSLSIVQE